MNVSSIFAGNAALPLTKQASHAAPGMDFAALLTPPVSGDASTSAPSANSAGGSASASTIITPPGNLTDPAVLAFMKYMNETPAERMEDAWLASHGLTRDDLKKMTPEKREAIMKEMAKEIKDELERKAQEHKNEPIGSQSASSSDD